LPVSPAKSVESLLSPTKSIVSISSTRSPSPLVRTKREHVDSDGEDLLEAPVAKAQKVSANAGRPKAGDYESSAKEVILSAANTYRALLVSQGAFPTSLEELDLVKKAWKRVNDDSEMDPPMGLTPDIVRIVSFLILFLPCSSSTYFQGQGPRISGPWRGEK
jgi:hypothetical protein